MDKDNALGRCARATRMPGTWALLLLLVVASRLLAGQAPESNRLLVGYADIDITPPLGVPMPGYFQERKATGVLDTLLAKSLVLTKGEVTLAIIALDLIGLSDSIVADIRGEIQRQTGIAPERIFIHAIHTHTGAAVSHIKDRLAAQVTTAVKKAVEKRVDENRVTLGACNERSIAFIRRYLMEDGTVRTNPGRGNPRIVRPIGDIDPAVYAMSFETAKIVLVSYGLHPDCVSGDKYSADYPYHMTEAIRETLGPDWNVIFLNACCGNVNHINVKDKSQRSSYDESRKIGRTLAEAALAARDNSRDLVMDTIAARAGTVQCPARIVPKNLREWAERQIQENPAEASRRKFNEYTPSRIMKLTEAEGTTRPAEIIVFRIGDVAIVGLPGEVFVEVARDIKTHSLTDPTLVIGLTGGSMGYIPHPRGYQEGGYEATFGSARNSPETPILWCDTAARLIKELRN
ncbi:MAG: hypothetical protein JSU70_22335 [Phycisphaerales bacterium]|nr:MAG: hypothetical protein JSU70_22335 [Phycisphaerales bacterium]